MSAEATGYVWQHSPATGATFTVHLAIADVVNDTHGNEFFARMATLADKARVNQRTARRAVNELVELGYLEVVDESGPNRIGRYRFIFDVDEHQEDDEAELELEDGPPPPDDSDISPHSGAADSDISPYQSDISPYQSDISPGHRELETNSTEHQRPASSDEPPSSSDELEGEFESSFWPAYPRRTGKAAALKAYKALRRKRTLRHPVTDQPLEPTEAAILAALGVYKDDLATNGTPAKFIMHASTFLNGRWLDYVGGAPVEDEQYDLSPLARRKLHGGGIAW